MWRSNVLRLRKCSSITTLRHGVNRLRYSSQTSLPVTEHEFEDALNGVVPLLSNAKNNARLGFAISGGVDSMALAALYSRAQNESLPNAHAFIVDHKVRSESTEEAAWVQEVLRSKLNTEASILTLDWSQDPTSLDLKRFETEARTLRYQALGKACRDMGISALMVAHHGDDQAETIMMRLAKNRLRSGLCGMQSVAWIPECEGIYGVHHSGAQLDQIPACIPFPIEKGGIRILRPLLRLPKLRLIATCEQMGMPWAEDKSNNVRTLTSRNAIRHVYKESKLPQALSIQSLINLSQNITQRLEEHESFADRLLSECQMKIDIQTGTLLIRFPLFKKLLGHPIISETDRNEARNNAYCLLKRVAGLITPDVITLDVGRLAGCIENVFPEFSSNTTVPRTPKVSAKSFTVHHIWWRQWPEKRSNFNKNKTWLPSPNHSQTWLLTRQTLMSEEAKDKSKQFLVPPQQASGTNGTSEDYHLFDGRWWICIQNLSDDSLVLRLFQEQDMSHLPDDTAMKQELLATNLQPKPTHFMYHALSLLKPSDIRFTLPALFRIDRVTGKESLIGFPTLNIHTTGFGSPPQVCDWDVRYKKVDFGDQSPANIVVPGVTVQDVQLEQRRVHKLVKAAKEKKAKNLTCSEKEAAEPAKEPFGKGKRKRRKEDKAAQANISTDLKNRF